MGNKSDRTGERYGKLVILGQVHVPKGRGRVWLCQCDCGNQKACYWNNISAGIKSCGCYYIGRKHGDCGSKEYYAWSNMKVRCYKKGRAEYKDYGGRGITVCDKWKNSYLAFLGDMGRAPSSNHSVDRINPDGNYEPGNCRWATAKEQSNNRRNNKFFEYNNQSHSLKHWAELFSMTYQELYRELKSRGKDLAQVISERGLKPST